MSFFFVNAALIALLALIAFLALRLHRLFAVVMLSGAFSLTAAAQFVVLDAVDVAFTEAAVGAGISTVLALATLSLVPAEEKPHSLALVPAFLAISTGLLLMLAVSDLPPFGDPQAPIHLHVAPDYIIGSAKDIDVPNVVTSVLASYRGYDTLGETVVVFTAAIAVLLIIGGYTRAKRPATSAAKSSRKNKGKGKEGKGGEDAG
jgi:multicomponent Na+:H+ antiporter subunit B